MATSISQDASSVLSGVDQATQNKILSAGSGSVLTSGEAKALLAQYGVDPNATLSTGNIQQTTTSPVPAPDDLLGIRRRLYEENGVNTAQSAYEAAIAAANNAQATLDQGNLQLRNRPVSVGKFTGQIAQNTMVSSQNINNLQDAARLALESVNAKKSEANAQFAIRESEVTQKRTLQAQYPGAKISLSDSFDSAISKIDKYQKDAEKDVYKKALKAKAMELGIKTSGSSKDLEKRISKQSKSALADAKKKSELELDLLRANIEQTKKQTANIGKKTGDEENAIGTTIEVQDPNNPLNTYLVDKKTGKIVDVNKIMSDSGIIPPATQVPETSWWNQFKVSEPSTWFNF